MMGISALTGCAALVYICALCSIVELERPAQYHTDPKIPYHTFRPGLPAGIIDHDLGSGKSSKGGSKKASNSEKIPIIEGVISKVSDTSISMFLSSKEDANHPELPSRCRMWVVTLFKYLKACVASYI